VQLGACDWTCCVACKWAFCKCHADFCSWMVRPRSVSWRSCMHLYLAQRMMRAASAPRAPWCDIAAHPLGLLGTSKQPTPSRDRSAPPPRASATPMHAAPLPSPLSSSAKLNLGAPGPPLETGRPVGSGPGAQASAEPGASAVSMHAASSAGPGRSTTGALLAARCTKVTAPAATAARSGPSSTLPDTSWTGPSTAHESVARCSRDG